MPKRNENKVQYPSTQVERYTSVFAEHEAVIVELHTEDDLRRPTEAVTGVNTAQGGIVWVAIAEDDALQEVVGADHYVTVDSYSTRMSSVEVMTASIERLTIARDQLARLQAA